MIRTDGIKNHAPVQMTMRVQQNQEQAHNKKAEECDPFTQQALSEKDMEKVTTVLEYLNKTMTVFDRSLEFSVHEDTNRIIVRVINRLPEGDEVIREIPPERILDLVAALMNIVGLLVDQRA